MSKHTPGPWIARPDPSSNPGDHPEGDFVVGVGESIDSIAVVGRLANARLVAAAPDLLAALEDICLELGDCGLTEKARAAIAKATEAQP